MNKTRVLIEETTREEREAAVKCALGSLNAGSEPVRMLYQYYVDGKLELDQIDQIMRAADLLFAKENLNTDNLGRIAEIFIRKNQSDNAPRQFFLS